MFLHMEEPSELVDQCFHLYHIQIELQNRLVAQSVKNLLEIQETGVQSLGREDPLQKGMAIHSSTFAWRIPWTEELGRPQIMGSQSQTQLSN